MKKPDMEIEKRYFTPGEVSKILGVSYVAIWIASSEHSVGKKKNGKTKFTKQDIQKLKELV